MLLSAPLLSSPLLNSTLLSSPLLSVSPLHPVTVPQVQFAAGTIVELNNQAKHAVSNHWDRPRVHLIFDYVEEHPIKQRFVLKPGEQLYQTRRSIDLAVPRTAADADASEARRKAPTFVIIGAQVR
jgi:hypothetical protein